MSSKAWKDLERRAAEILGGCRLKRMDFSLSQPDVVANIKFSDSYSYTILAECKYSINQPWQKYILGHLDRSKDISIVTSDKVLFWDLTATKEVMELMIIGTIADLFMNKVQIVNVSRSLPRYLDEWFNQAKSYSEDTDWSLHHPNLKLEPTVIPILVLGQANSRTKIAAARYDWVIESF